MKDIPKAEPLRRWLVLACAGMLLLGAVLYFYGLRHNPPGFSVDESSIAFNAHNISQTGRDEYGASWPLFFRAFGEFKNPVYIYLLAAIFRLTGPGIFAARLFSASAGLATAVALGLLAWRVTSRRAVGVFVAVSALLTPWLFELSRVVLEVNLYPLFLAVFLLCVHRASERAIWTWSDIGMLATTLTLLTYTYSIGRLLAPLFALGLVLFYTRERLRSLLYVWGCYWLALIPLIIFHFRHPDALNARFRVVTYITPQTGYAQDAWQFVKHYIANLKPWVLLITGSPEPQQSASVYGIMLAGTFLLAVAGAWLVLRRKQRNSWWLFVVYGLCASIVPASLTREYFHPLRLAPLPIFLLVLAAPAFAWLMENGGRMRRAALTTVISLTLIQGAWFQWQYHASSRAPQRLHLFDADYPTRILPTALAATSSGPIYITDAPAIPGYIQAYWYATLWHIPLAKFIVLAPDVVAPAGAIVITTEAAGPRCRWLAESEPYVVCFEEGPPRMQTILPDNSFRAELSITTAPVRLKVGQQITIKVLVKNLSDVIWLGPRERAASPLQLSVANHWLDLDGKIVVNDDGRGPLPQDLRPGETAEIPLTLNAPARAGDYLIEIDMLQEGVSWFGLKGSKSWRGTLKVE